MAVKTKQTINRFSKVYGFRISSAFMRLLRMSWAFSHLTFENNNYDNRLDGAIKTTLANWIEKITEKTAKRMKWHNEMQNATKSSSHRVLNIPTCITMSVYGLKHIFFLSLIIHVFICNFELIRVLNMRFKFIFFFLDNKQNRLVLNHQPFRLIRKVAFLCVMSTLHLQCYVKLKLFQFH